MSDREQYQKLFLEMDSGSALHELIVDDEGNPVDYRFLAVNPAFERQTGLDGASIIGKTVREIMPGIEDHWISTYGKVALSGVPTRFESYAAELGRHYQVTAYSPQRGQFAVIFNDVTHLKEVEDELKQNQQKLMKANAELVKKNAELERLNYTISHDLKSPLITIKGFMGMLKEDISAGDTDSVQKDIDNVCTAADKMEILLNEILEFSRIGSVAQTLEKISLTEVATEALLLVEGQVMERGVKVHIDGKMPVILVDKRRIREVYQNLFDNAIKFMGDQVRPELTASSTNVDGKPCFYVRDNGMGIEPEYLTKIFGLFDQLDQRIPGTGIGLALVKRTIERHGGSIWAESEGLGKGTTVYFTLAEEETDAE